jgi:5-methylcytosine-specific restriction endonuclease McrBC regulatory subunit McrC
VNLISLKDNTPNQFFSVGKPFDSVRKALDSIAGKNLKLLADRDLKFIIYPPFSKELDVKCNDVVFNVDYSDVSKPKITTGNIMGFVCLNDDVRVNIISRFDSDNKNYFLHYMLQKICNVVYTPRTDAGEDSFYDFLYYLFPNFLNEALKQGVFRAYVNREYNDANVRGPIDVSRHIRYNIPFNGKIAYHTREYTTDNYVTQLVRHTIEYIRLLSCGKSVLDSDMSSKTYDNIRAIEFATPTYNRKNRQHVISKNLRPVTHPYYTAYEPLRKICLAILLHKKLSYGENSTSQINGILFDGACLWEEYLNTVLVKKFKDCLIHPNNRTGSGVQYLFKDDNYQKFRRIYPDFLIDCDVKEGTIESAAAIIDAKYKRLDEKIDRDDVYQILAYLFRFKSKQGFLVHPVEYCKVCEPRNLTLYNDDSVKLTIVPFVVPKTTDSFEEFCTAMKDAEEKMQEKLKLI